MRWTRRTGRLTLAVIAFLPAVTRAQTTAEPPTAVLQSGVLSFSAHATVGDFVGTTSTMSGVVTGDQSDARGWVEAPVGSLATHNDHRDRDLRGSMEVEKYPTMRFALGRISSTLAVSEGHFAVMLHGRLTIHGVTRDVDLPATIDRGADTIHVTSSFPLNLEDYHIGGLKKMLGLLRMDPRIEVHVDLRFISNASINP
jgi:polyisoprenoid-binding protein YceI